MTMKNTDRYSAMFSALKSKGEGAFVPFVVAGDPDPQTSLIIITALAESGADALEIGLPFSDPVADGPTIQKADQRAIASGMKTARVWDILGEVRARHPDIPIGLLVYANLIEAPGRTEFYRMAAEAGVDSVLVADVPTIEAAPYVKAATENGILPVLIAAPGGTEKHLADVASLSRGYTYVVSRLGVTGAENVAGAGNEGMVAALGKLGAPPCMIGFGISGPGQVREALKAGAAGAISGSAIVKLIEKNLDDVPEMISKIVHFTETMKAATRRSS